jgi:mediator of RNA polymerase II transcription subunit 8
VVQDSLKSHLHALQEIFRDQNKSAFLKSAHAYPTSSYPWSEENTLGLLLRKRLEPDIVTWVNNARASGVGLDADPSPTLDETAMDVDLENKGGKLKSADWAELWDWAAPAANQIAREILYEEEDEDDDDEDDDDEGDHNDKQKAVTKADGRMMNLDDLLRFSSTGRGVMRATT